MRAKARTQAAMLLLLLLLLLIVRIKFVVCVWRVLLCFVAYCSVVARSLIQLLATIITYGGARVFLCVQQHLFDLIIVAIPSQATKFNF